MHNSFLCLHQGFTKGHLLYAHCICIISNSQCPLPLPHFLFCCDICWLIYIFLWTISLLVAQSCPLFATPVDYSLPGSSVHGILQARILGWVAIPFSRGSSQPRGRAGSPAWQAGSLSPWRQDFCLFCFTAVPLALATVSGTQKVLNKCLLVPKTWASGCLPRGNPIPPAPPRPWVP